MCFTSDDYEARNDLPRLHEPVYESGITFKQVCPLTATLLQFAVHYLMTSESHDKLIKFTSCPNSITTMHSDIKSLYLIQLRDDDTPRMTPPVIFSYLLLIWNTKSTRYVSFALNNFVQNCLRFVSVNELDKLHKGRICCWCFNYNQYCLLFH